MNQFQSSRHCFLFVMLLMSGVTSAQSAVLESDTAVAAAGFFRLSWESAVPVRLVESRDDSFATRTVVYAGADTARVVSGKPNGDWHYRLEEIDSGRVASDPVTVTVQHHSLQKAWAFFAVGALVFLATVGLIVVGGRDGAESQGSG